MTDKLMTIAEVCDMYSVTRRSVYAWRVAGKVETLHTAQGIRLKQSEVERVATHKLPIISNRQLLTKLHTLESEIHELKKLISQLTPPAHETNSRTTAQTNVYESRKQEAISKAVQAYQSLDKPTKIQVAKVAGISRTTVGKYWSEITAHQGGDS